MYFAVLLWGTHKVRSQKQPWASYGGSSSRNWSISDKPRTNRVTGSRAENSTTSKPVVCLKLFSRLKGLVKFQSYYSKNTSWSSHSTSQDTLKIFFVHISKLVFNFLLFYYLLLFHLVQITSSRDMKQSRACNSQGCVGFKTNTPKISYWIRGFAHNEVFMYKSTCTYSSYQEEEL